jgi:hypothetical protein
MKQNRQPMICYYRQLWGRCDSQRPTFRTKSEQVVCIDMLGNFEQSRTLMPSLVTRQKLIEAALHIFTKQNAKHL